MALGEIFLAAFIQVVLDRLAPREIRSYFGNLHGDLSKKLGKWRETLSAIGAVLRDAEEKQLTSEAVKLWLDELRDLAHDMDDILDKFSTETLRRKVKERNRAGMSKVRGLFPKVKFHFNMNSKMEEIARRLQIISNRKDVLGLKYVEAVASTASQRTPSSYVLEGPVVGRDEDRRKIVEMLLSRDEPCSTNFHAVAIVGMPGIGKTTLAGHVFNADAVEQFTPKAWVSVSDNFSVERVTKKIFKFITSQDCDLDEFSKVQENLSKKLAGKKFLIVLDDVWSTCNYGLWTKLQSPFRVGAPGSKIIVTTRDEKVAKMMGAIEVHNLEPLADDDCLKLFEQHAFLDSNNGRPSYFDSLLQQKILERCSGLPLAASTLGGLLRCEEPDKWDEILNNNLWSLVDERNTLPVLKLSYHYLPSYLKRCFAYCSIFPDDYEFGENQLILLWMAEGLLQQPDGSKKMEDIGGEYFGKLLSRSLFQKSSKTNSAYKMHDLVGDLARWAAGAICLRLDDKAEGRSSPKTRYSSYISGHYDGVKKFEAFHQAKGLRTFLPLKLSTDKKRYLTTKVALDLLPKLQYLRVLSFNGYQITELPKSIGKLKHVRYLDFSHTLITHLPESISTLYNLQTLILESCSKLKALPESIRNLTNLRHLNNSNVPSLEGMPLQLSQLTNLQTLPNFVVGKGRVSRVREIGPLLLLQGTLCLSRLENVIDGKDAEQVNLISKEGIDILKLEWSDIGENESVVLDMLKPHGKLKELSVKGYGGLQFSKWIGDPSFSMMVRVELEDCNNCQILPPFGQLLFLKELFIRGMSRVESVGLEFYGEAGSLSFPRLEVLHFEDMQQWKEWFHFEGDQGIGAFPSLKTLSIQICPKLEGRLPENLGSLESLDIDNCEELVVSIANFKQLSELSVVFCKEVVCGTTVTFELVKDILLIGVEQLVIFEYEGLRRVETLALGCCNDQLPSVWQHIISLSFFGISSQHLHQLQHLTALQHLGIYQCSSLVSIPEASLPSSLTHISIETCDSLTHIARYKIPPCLIRIEIENCKNLKFLAEEEEEEGELEEASCLKYLEISDCPSLTCLSFKRQLPRALKWLGISNCKQLETICESSLHHNSCLEHIGIEDCANLKSLPEGLCYLTHLQTIIIRNCGSLVSFPSGGLPARASNLTFIGINSCPKLEALPKGMDKNNLTSLQTLHIGRCEGLASIVEEGFPPNLTSLEIAEPTRCKPLSEWGSKLHGLSSLKELWLAGVDDHLASFPPEHMLLPQSLIKLEIWGFPKLRRLSRKGFQSLTSLEYLTIRNCPKLACIPKGLSITRLDIYEGCPHLTKKYRPGNSRHWARISHIPCVYVGDRVNQPQIW